MDSVANHIVWIIRRDSTNGNISPLHSRGRSTKAVEFKDYSHDDLHESGAIIKRTTRRGEEEDVLHEYVVLDRKIIETNQFADGNLKGKAGSYVAV